MKKVHQELMGEVCHAKLVLGDKKLFACLSSLQLKEDKYEDKHEACL